MGRAIPRPVLRGAKFGQHVPDRSQQTELQSLGPAKTRRLASRYCQALESADITQLLDLLVEDATSSMPPLPIWYQGRDAIAEFITREVFAGPWRHLVTQANGQLAVGAYTFDDSKHCYVASALDVLTIEGGRIAAVTAFLTSELLETDGQRDDRFVGAEAFPRFGLPARLDHREFGATR